MKISYQSNCSLTNVESSKLENSNENCQQKQSSNNFFADFDTAKDRVKVGNLLLELQSS